MINEIKAFLFKNGNDEFIASPDQVETKKLNTYVKCKRCGNFTDDPNDLSILSIDFRICNWCKVSFEEWLGKPVNE